MDRSRVVFAVIIFIAVFIIAGALLIQFIGGLIDDDTEQTAEPTPLPADTVLVSIASSNTKENWMNQVVEDFNAAWEGRVEVEIENATVPFLGRADLIQN